MSGIGIRPHQLALASMEALCCSLCRQSSLVS